MNFVTAEGNDCMKGKIEERMETQSGNNRISVAIDLCDDYSQICYYTGTMTEPESLSTIHDEQKYLIPTVVAKLNHAAEWCIGDIAKLHIKRHEAAGASSLIHMILKEKNMKIEEEEYSGKQLLELYICKLFELISGYCHTEQPDKVVFTLEYPDRLLVNVIHTAMQKMGIAKEDIRVIGHSESFIYYNIFQKKELWINDVLVFDFNETRFTMRRLNLVRARTPQPIIIEESDYSREIRYDMLKTKEGRLQADSRFAEIVGEICSGHIVSTIYLTGCGFYEKWMEESVKVLCNKHRVFQGYNLFVKGAGYASMDMFGIGDAGNYQFVCSGRTLVNIGLEVIRDGRELPLILSKAGTNWYEAGARIQCIPDQTREVTVSISSPFSKNKKEMTLNLNEFPERPNKNTRIEIALSYKNDRQCIIAVTDMGFGEFFKASGKTVRQVLNIEDYL